MAYKGRFRPTNPSKYKGDSSNIIYRSLWELRVFQVLDRNPDVNWWQSEEIAIPYLSPIDGRMHRYFPDVVFEKQLRSDPPTTQVVMVEIKPHNQTTMPDPSRRNATPSGRVSTRFLREVKRYGINEAKWDAARKYCDSRGWVFRVLTEHDLGIK